MPLLPIQTRIESSDIHLASFTGDDAGDLLKAAGEWIGQQGDVCLLGVNLVPSYCCPSGCEPEMDRPTIRLDLTLDVSARR